MKISIETIPNDCHRYKTCGDYWYDENGVLQIRVSDMGNELYETLIAVHELIEERITKQRGITEQEITDFDLMYEEERSMGLHEDWEEPGFDERAPYLDAHTYATSVEMNLCNKLGVDWNHYSNKVNSL